MKTFARWLRKTTLRERDLCDAVVEMAMGLIDADLSGYLFKKRLAIPGRGKRGGARVLIGTNLRNRWFFLFGFEKNARDDVDDDELSFLRDLAMTLLSANDAQLDAETDLGHLTEICNEEKSHTH